MENNKVFAFTATLPGRAAIASKAIRSILPQVYACQVVLNNFKSGDSIGFFTEKMQSDKLFFVSHDNSLEDGSRFINVEQCDLGYVLIFDDDIVYPPNYVQTLIAKYNLYGGMVAPMGKILKPRPIKSYYKDIMVSLRTFDTVEYDTPVQVPGACGILWHNSQVKVGTKDMLIPNSDLCLAKYAKDHNVRCTTIAHSNDWLTNLWEGEVTQQDSIYTKYRRNDAIQTDFVNTYL